MTHTYPGMAPLAALALVVLPAVPGCGKTHVTQVPAVALAPAQEVAEQVSVSGTVKLVGGKPSKLGEKVDVGGNPFCSGHGQLINPAWRLGANGGLADVVVTVKGSTRASNLPAESPWVDQHHCEFSPYMTTVQAGQSVRLHNSDLTFHNIRVVKHQAGTRSSGANLANLAQPSQGQENVQSFNEPGIYRLECDVHRWMRAWVVVHEGIHIASTGEDGVFSIRRALPDGTYEIEAWHPMFPNKLTRTITVRDGKATADFEFALPQSFEP